MNCLTDTRWAWKSSSHRFTWTVISSRRPVSKRWNIFCIHCRRNGSMPRAPSPQPLMGRLACERLGGKAERLEVAEQGGADPQPVGGRENTLAEHDRGIE